MAKKNVSIITKIKMSNTKHKCLAVKAKNDAMRAKTPKAVKSALVKFAYHQDVFTMQRTLGFVLTPEQKKKVFDISKSSVNYKC